MRLDGYSEFPGFGVACDNRVGGNGTTGHPGTLVVIRLIAPPIGLATGHPDDSTLAPNAPLVLRTASNGQHGPLGGNVRGEARFGAANARRLTAFFQHPDSRPAPFLNKVCSLRRRVDD